MRDAVIVSILSILPRTWTAWAMGWFARTGLSRLFTRLFVAAYGVDMTEAEPAEHASLESLFTRRLRAGVRPVDPRTDVVVSPVDGTCAWVGTTQGGQYEIAPGRRHTLARLLDAPTDGERDVAVLYLSPRDYHRVHAPADGVVSGYRYVPGTLWPVFPAAVRRVPELFGQNERVVVPLAGPVDLQVVLVGAFGVGRIGLAFDDLLSNASAPGGPRTLAAPVSLRAGDDLGVFHLGSTVVVVAPAGTLRWVARVGDSVRMGRVLAEVLPR